MRSYRIALVLVASLLMGPQNGTGDYEDTGGAITGMSNPATSDLDMNTFDIICDDSDAANDTKLVCDTDDQFAFECDGASCLILNPSVVQLAGNELVLASVAQAACAVGRRSYISHVQGGAGVADILEACVKSAADTYSYIDLLGAGGGLSSPLSADLDFDGNDLITDTDGDSKWDHSVDDVVGLDLGGANEYSFSATGLDMQGNNLVTSPDAATVFGFGTNARVQLDNTGATVNSPTFALVGDDGGVELEANFVMIQGPVPTLRINVDDDNTTPVATEALNITATGVTLASTTLTVPVNGLFDWEGRARLSSTGDGELNIADDAGVENVILKVPADNRLEIIRSGGAGAPIRLIPIAAGTEAQPTCDATTAGMHWLTDATTDETAEVCLETSSVYGWEQYGPAAAGGSFDGNLNGNELGDDTDSIIKLRAGDIIQFDQTNGTRLSTIQSAAGDEALLFRNNTGTDGFALFEQGTAMVIGSADATALAFVDARRYRAKGTVGGAADARMYSPTAGVGVLGLDSVGGITWSSSTSANCTARFEGTGNCDLELNMDMDGVLEIREDETAGGGVKFGEPTAGPPACTSVNTGILVGDLGAANQLHKFQICTRQSTGAADTYSYRQIVGATTHILVGGDTPNTVTTALTAAGGWEQLLDTSGDIWTVNIEDGFDFEVTADEQLTALTGSGGLYDIQYGVSATSSAVNAVVNVAIQVDDGATPVRCGHIESKYPQNDSESSSSGCVINIDDGDEVYMVANTDGDTNFTVRQSNIRLKKL